ncbi:MAG: hypothetical protein NTW66_01800 [Candidatus Magasanikbacteria bacterium]|nr:hypothetical protein [Candidatus Magasanikbacteria bacterium]
MDNVKSSSRYFSKSLKTLQGAQVWILSPKTRGVEKEANMRKFSGAVEAQPGQGTRNIFVVCEPLEEITHFCIDHELFAIMVLAGDLYCVGPSDVDWLLGDSAGENITLFHSSLLLLLALSRFLKKSAE